MIFVLGFEHCIIVCRPKIVFKGGEMVKKAFLDFFANLSHFSAKKFHAAK